jgi:hypothetical protein
MNPESQAGALNRKKAKALLLRSLFIIYRWKYERQFDVAELCR